MSGLPHTFKELIQRVRSLGAHGTLPIAALIGVVGALFTIGFREALVHTEHLISSRGRGLVDIAAHLPLWIRWCFPMAGGVLAGLALAWARRSARQSRASDYMEAIALGDGNLGLRVSLLRALSSALTVVSGGAIGREGSMVQLSALGGSLVGRWRRAPMARRRLMVACGAAAGVATAYNAPIAGAMFVAEIVLHSVAIESLGPLIVAAVTAHVTATQLLGVGSTYHMPPIPVPEGWETLSMAALGVIAGLGAPVYRAVLDFGHRVFRRWKAPLWLKLAAGGLVVGILSLAYPEVWGNGYSVVDSILQGGWLWPALLAVLVFKIVAVAATTGSGAIGGIFTPTLFVGAVTGALFGTLLEAVWPGHFPVAVCAAVGMGAFLAACTHAPLMSILIIVEMTGNYGLMVPLMLASVIAYSISRVLREDSIYSEAAGIALPTPALAMAADFLHGDSATVQEDASLQDLEDAFLHHRRPNVYVLDAQRRFLGAVSIMDVAPLIRQGADPAGPWPRELLRTDFPTVREDAPAWQVLEVFATHAGERLPVLDAQRRLLGHVTKNDLVLMLR